MEKRTRLAIVLLVGIILLLIGLWIFLTPLLQKEPAAQPPELPASATPSEAPLVPRMREAPIVTPAASAKPTAESGMLALQNRARSLAERMGTGTSANGFLGFSDVSIDATFKGKIALAAARAYMQSQHPASGPAYGVTAKAVTAVTDAGAYGDDQITISMDIVLAEDSGSPEKLVSTTNAKATMTFAKQGDGTYLLDSFTIK